MSANFFIYTTIISLGLMARLIFSDCGNAVTNPRYQNCPINLTIAIDFSTAMENETNIENLLNFVLLNFTNKLPFNDSNFYITLLSFGTKNGIKIYNYVQSYEEFCGQVHEELGNYKRDHSVEVKLSEVLSKYLEFISNGHDINQIKCDSPLACTNKLALFTAIHDETNVNESMNIAHIINSHSRIIAIGINQPLNDLLFDISWMAYGRVLFDNYTLWPENPLEPFLSTSLCTFTVKNYWDYRECGEHYCQETSCYYKPSGRNCYFLAGCVHGQCLYWDLSARFRDNAQTECQNINSTLVVMYNKTFQEGLYKIAGDFEYWIDLTSTDYANPIWKWSDVNLTLKQTNYTNWAYNKAPTSTNKGNSLCVTDTNSSENFARGWKVVPCSGTFELDNMTLGNFRPFICSRAASPLPNTKPSHKNFPIVISMLSITSLILLFIFLAIGRHYYRKHQERQQLQHETFTNPNISTLLTNLSAPQTPYLSLSESDGSLFSRIFGIMENVNKLIFPHEESVYEFKWEDLENLGLLEATSRHQVGKFLHKPSNHTIVIKSLTIPYSRFDDEAIRMHFRKMLREIENFRSLWECPNIVTYYGLCIHEGHALLCMESMDLSLKQLYLLVHREKKEKLPEDVVGYFFVKILDALIYCKNKGIIHRDIKPDNILVNFSGEVKLCDFGESRILDNSLASTNVGTTAYWPPERFSSGSLIHYDIRADVWSLGITLIEIILGRLPYNISNQDTEFCQSFMITNTNFDEVIDGQISLDYSENLCCLLKLCTRRVENRPKIYELKETLFYEKYANFGIGGINEFLLALKSE